MNQGNKVCQVEEGYKVKLVKRTREKCEAAKPGRSRPLILTRRREYVAAGSLRVAVPTPPPEGKRFSSGWVACEQAGPTGKRPRRAGRMGRGKVKVNRVFRLGIPLIRNVLHLVNLIHFAYLDGARESSG